MVIQVLIMECMSAKRLRRLAMPRRGPRVWLMLEMSVQMASIISEMAKRYDIEPAALVRLLTVEALEARETPHEVKIKGSQVMLQTRSKNISAQQ